MSMQKFFLNQEEGSNKQLSYMYNSSHQANNTLLPVVSLHVLKSGGGDCNCNSTVNDSNNCPS